MEFMDKKVNLEKLEKAVEMDHHTKVNILNKLYLDLFVLKKNRKTINKNKNKTMMKKI
jgi:hypothetical protein